MTVTGASPVVDMQSSKVGTDFTTDKLVGVPTATDVWAVLGQASGVRMNGFDVGGSHKSQQTGYESFGIRNQNRVLNDGVDTTEGTGGAGFYADFFANEEVAVSAAGGDVEMNAPGSAVVNTIKSGGNTVQDAQQPHLPAGIVRRRTTSTRSTSARGYTGQPNIKFWEGHTDIGGPIKTDKVWFFGAYNHFKIDKQISGVPRTIATDLGVFDNYDDQGNLEGVAEGHRRRLLPVGPEAEAEPRPVGDRVAGGGAAAGQRLLGLQGRALSACGPIACSPTSRSTCSATTSRSASRPTTRRSRRASTPARNFTSGAAWDAFDLARQKPAVTAQATYYVPAGRAATTSRSASSTCSTSPSTRSTAARARSSTAT